MQFQTKFTELKVYSSKGCRKTRQPKINHIYVAKHRNSKTSNF